ncbi:Heterogeneous nuclear ribonucleoprotein M [Tupaia chinensis]|uniref:Heterogeneous nuclear ribonucleoprotein M n=1 Tax=Tupaia chinensis TaxID=246437 RepID=L9JLE5_TUPCH|nr:Heterogeneous nuclear ribonucleoprotein M [Tupaia chinensis]
MNGGGEGSVLGIERMYPGDDHIGSAGMEHMGTGLGHGMDHVGSKIERMGLVMDRMGSVERMGSIMERMGLLALDHMVSSIERMVQTMERMVWHGTNGCRHRLRPEAHGCTHRPCIERMVLAMAGRGGANFDRANEMECGNLRGNFSGSFGGAGGHALGVAQKACQIFARNLPFDFTWKILKGNFKECRHALYANKMENRKSKGCGVVKFESPEVAERACWMMNGMKLSDRETDVRIDRNA